MRSSDASAGQPAVPSSNAEFEWFKQTNKNLATCVAIKQQAVDDAFKHAKELCETADKTMKNMTRKTQQTFDMLGGKHIRAWMQEINELESASGNLEVLVGVAGNTGVGKTFLLNTLLGIPELLPSSSNGVGTATICRLAWNKDQDPSKAFKAEVIFRPEHDVIKELKDLLSDLEDRRELKSDQDFEGGEAKRQEELTMLNDRIAHNIKGVCETWKMDEKGIDTREMTPGIICQQNKTVLELLGSTTEIISAEEKDFTKKIKSYLDKSSSADGVLWPLIQEVRLYIKSDILKHGMTLVDLPGLSDRVDARAAIAEQYFGTLNIVASVAAGIRATDEKTSAKLFENLCLTKFQEMRMKLDGKFNKKGFCVVVSKIDDMDADGFAASDPVAKSDTDLQKDVKEAATLRSQCRELEKKVAAEKNQAKTHLKERRRAAKDNKSGKTAAEGDEEKRLKVQQNTARKSLKQQKRTLAQVNKRLSMLKNRITRRCIQIRNADIQGKYQEEFEQRQIGMASRAPVGDGQVDHDNTLNVFPVSAKAYRELQQDREPLSGFLSMNPTGIPTFRRWLEDVTNSRRESHLDSILQVLQRLFHIVRSWSQNVSRAPLRFSSEKLLNVLEDVHKKYRHGISAGLIREHTAITKTDPVNSYSKNSEIIWKKATEVAERWSRTFPDRENSPTMSWMSYQALLKRGGGPFTGYLGSGGKFTHDWPDSMAVVLFTAILPDWDCLFTQVLPSKKAKMIQDVKRSWVEYVAEIKSTIAGIAPKVLSYFDDVDEVIRNLEGELNNKISNAIDKLIQTSTRVHPKVVVGCRERLAPMFSATLQITGSGSFYRRQVALKSKVQGGSKPMFEHGYKTMKAGYEKGVESLERDLSIAVKWAIKTVKSQIEGLFTDLLLVNTKNPVAQNTKRHLQEVARKAVVEWASDWRKPKCDLEGLSPLDGERADPFLAGDDDTEVKLETDSDGSMEDSDYEMDTGDD